MTLCENSLSKILRQAPIITLLVTLVLASMPQGPLFSPEPGYAAVPSTPRWVYVVVALVDNRTQRIVKVPEKIGDGDDPQTNLYWGAAYGVKTHFSKSSDWKLVRRISEPVDPVLERCVFHSRTSNVILVADAFRGSRIRDATLRYFEVVGGGACHDSTLMACDSALDTTPDLVIYVGHDGLLDFDIEDELITGDGSGVDVAALCCYSQRMFGPKLEKLQTEPLVLTTGLMAPEAYVLEAILKGWIAGEARKAIQTRAAYAYDQYQHCGQKASRRLFGLK